MYSLYHMFHSLMCSFPSFTHLTETELWPVPHTAPIIHRNDGYVPCCAEPLVDGVLLTVHRAKVEGRKDLPLTTAVRIDHPCTGGVAWEKDLCL